MKKIAHFLSKYELLLLGVAAPLWLFPIGWLPWVGVFLIGLTWVSRRVSRGRWTVQTGAEIPALILIGMALVGYGISIEPGLSRARLWNILLDLAVFYGLANGLRLREGKALAKQVGWLAAGVAAGAVGAVG